MKGKGVKNEKEKGKDFWDANPCAGRWNSFKDLMDFALGIESWIYDLLTDDFLSNKKVLEVGCGQGMALMLSARKCKAITGLDISVNSLKEAEKGIKEFKLQNTSLISGDAENLPFEDESYDAVYSLGVLHHTPNTQKAVLEINRVLKRDGEVIVMLYKKHNPKWFAVVLFRAFSKLIDITLGKEYYLANAIGKFMNYEDKSNIRHGTALLELFGCPTLKMYSKKEAIKMFKDFRDVEIVCYQSGFSRLFDFLPETMRGGEMQSMIERVDEISKDRFGFYMVIRGKKSGEQACSQNLSN
jgi:ubiquinone/menaquinone biosynthesis C-methylase UbiE